MNPSPLEQEQETLDCVLEFLDTCCGDSGQNIDAICDLLLLIPSDSNTSLGSSELLEGSQASDGLSSAEDDHMSSTGRDQPWGLQSDCDLGDTHQQSQSIRESSTRTRQRAATTRCKAVAPTAARRRMKNDILELQEQVLQLTAHLRSLQARKARTPPRDATGAAQMIGPRLPPRSPHAMQGSTGDLSAVVLERQKRQEAETLNLKLRVEWRKQMKLARKLESVLKKQMATLDLGFLVEATSQPLIHTIPTISGDPSQVFASLHDYLGSIYCETALIQASISVRDTSRVFSSSHVHHDMALGQTFEFITNSPVECSIRDLEKHIWTRLSTNDISYEMPPNVSHTAREPTRTCHEHQFTQKLNCKYGTIHVNGVSVIRKFVEPQKTVICFAATLVLAGSELTFRESGWIILRDQREKRNVNREDATPFIKKPSATLLQTCFRMRPEKSSAASNSCTIGDAAYFSDFIAQSQCETMRKHQLELQSALLEKFRSTASTQHR